MDKGIGLTRQFFVQLAEDIVKEIDAQKITRVKSDLLTLPDRLIAVFESAQQKFRALEKERKQIPVGADWILDNYYVLERNLKLFKKLYSKQFDSALIKIRTSRGVFPRLFVICKQFLLETNQSISQQFFRWILEEVSKRLELTLAELWALKEVLRIALIDNLADIVEEIRLEVNDRELLANYINALYAGDGLNTEKTLTFLKKILQDSRLAIKHARFILDNLREREEGLLAASFLERFYKEKAVAIDELDRIENFRLANRQLLISETFHSLREIENIDFSEILEAVSVTHTVCSEDSLYSQSDFLTRNRVRTEIERLARRFKISEADCAQRCVNFSKRVGVSLLDAVFYEHRDRLIQENFSLNFLDRLQILCLRWIERNKLKLYLTTPLVLSVISTFCITRFMLDLELLGYFWPVSSFITLFLFFELFLQIQNSVILRLLPPRFCPRLDLKKIPSEHQIAIVNHDIVADANDINEALERLLGKAFTDDDENILWFALLDLKDSKVCPDDSRVQMLADHASSLAFKLRREYGVKIFALIRKPVYSSSEGAYIGWERKRGKLLEFLKLCADPNSDTTFINLDETIRSELSNVKFCITLDSDTTMSKGAILDLLGYALHPCNKPVFGEDNRVIKGYSIYQPRVNVNLSSFSETYFSMLMSDSEGFDPYTREVSDLYFDVFDEANFVGKGLLRVDSFLKAVGERFPDNSILSHDMIESVFSRAAFVPAVEFFDDVPTNYISYSKRLHRWFRGDWQLLPWLFKKQVHSLGKWKIFDNLRRSLIPVFIFLSIILTSTFAGHSVTFLIALVGFIFLFPLFVSFSQLFVLGPRDLTLAQRFLGFQLDFKKVVAQAAFWISCLPHQAFNSLHAVGVTLIRLITRRNLLEWTSFSIMEKQGQAWTYYVPIFGIQVLSGLALLLLTDLILGEIFALFFFAGPFVALAVSSKVKPALSALTVEEIEYFEKLAVDTYLYFDGFLKPEWNYLIPDNFQLIPDKRVAERTSPTNLGYSLLAPIGAYYLGVIDIQKCVETLRKILSQLDTLDRLFGHFYNWYDIRTKRPLEPKYISFADSGNLLASLVVVRSFLEKCLAGVLPALQRSCFTVLKSATGLDVIDVASSGNKAALASIDPRFRRLIERVIQLLSDHKNVFESKVFEIFPDLWENSRICKALAEKLIDEMDFDILYNKDKKLFSIGYNVDSARKDSGCYDFLCSEARLSYFTVLALKSFDPKIWFNLSRVVGKVHGYHVPLSWSGTAFEYLMPELFVKTFKGSFIHLAVDAAIRVQRKYGELNGIPWGISESAYSLVDLNGNFQYKAFGVPGLGLKRGLEEELVVSPYSSIMASMFDPKGCLKNLIKLETKFQARGEMGFFEAIDFSRSRLEKGQRFFVVKSFFAHHHGMSFIALVNLLRNDVIKELFHSAPQVAATEPLLWERRPKIVVTVSVEDLLYSEPKKSVSKAKETAIVLKSPHTGYPKTHFVSNGDLVSCVDSGGGGFLYSKRFNIFLTRWRPEPAKDRYGYYIYLTNEETGEVFSAAYQPVQKKGDLYEVFFAPDKFEIKQRFGSLFFYLEGTVSQVLPCEIRKMSVTNLGPKTHLISVTSYAEVCLASLAADLAHPAFQKLFITSEILKGQDTIIFEKRPRGKHDKRIFLGHKLVISKVFKPTEFETDRFKFIGRARCESNPVAVLNGRLSNSQGVVLDPVFSIKQYLSISPGQTESVYYLTAVGESKEEVLETLNQLSDPVALHYQFELSWSQSNIELKSQIYNPGNFTAYQQLANVVMYGISPRRHESFRRCFSQRDLWKIGISGDYPVILVLIKSEYDLQAVNEIIEAFGFIHRKGLPCEMVIVNLVSEGYFQKISEQLNNYIKIKHLQDALEQPKGIFIRNRGQVDDNDLLNLKSFATIIFDKHDSHFSDTLENTLEGLFSTYASSESKVVSALSFTLDQMADVALPVGENFGFAEDGSFVGFFTPSDLPRAPWSNVVSDNRIGFLTTETGAGFSWAFNSREFRLTPWSNDPVTNPFNECIFIRKNLTGELFSPWLCLKKDHGMIKVKHSFGFSEWSRRFAFGETRLIQRLFKGGIAQELEIRVVNDDELDIFYYIEPVLAVSPFDSSRFLTIEYDERFNLFIIENGYSDEFRDYALVIYCDAKVESYSCSQFEFLGLYGDIHDPAFFKTRSSGKLSSRLNEPWNSCLVFQVRVRCESGNPNKVRFYKTVVERTNLDEFKSRLVSIFGDDITDEVSELSVFKNTISVTTPSKSVNVLAKWLPYQTTSCRLFGRSGFYQSGGAYGFRDQLQDSLMFLYFDPSVTRHQILLHASRQFIEGDVQHWWHPPSGKGTRTRFSDDFLWLPFTVLEYLKFTGDYSVLDEQVEYLKGPLLKENEHEIYIVPEISNVKESIYEHCKKAILNGFKYGDRGLPLIGIGDWNDGFSEVGAQGRGESVWLAWFQATIFSRFSEICRKRGDYSFADELEERTRYLVETVEKDCWDGDWYLRAFYDNGDPLGSKQSDECQIDSLVQSWAVLSGFGEPSRARRALNSCLERLVDRENRIIKLLEPPFDKGKNNPGYIKGYLPGIRENGAQYTHAAIWFLMALAELGEVDLALELFEMINPVNIYITNPHALDKYVTEPYVLCGDVYSNEQQSGRGGWSWYTGSAGWAVRLIFEYFLGVVIVDGKVYFKRKPPTSWDTVEFKWLSSRIKIINGPADTATMRVNGELVSWVNFYELKSQSLYIEVKW